MTVEALLAKGETGAEKIAPMDLQCVVWLENRIDAMQATLPAIDKFTIPGGHEAVSLCHVCRTVCRRSERAALRADQKYGFDAVALAYLNRLSDYFLCARTVVNGALWGGRNALDSVMFS